MQTRATSPLDSFVLKSETIVHEEIYLVIKFDVLCPGDGTYPAFPDEKERLRIQRLKKECYTNCALRLQHIGLLSSQIKKNYLISYIKEAIVEMDERILEMRAFLDPTRVCRSVVMVSIFRALLNGLVKAKLSDGKLVGFDDSE